MPYYPSTADWAEARRTILQSAIIHPDWTAEIHHGYLRQEGNHWISLTSVQAYLATAAPLAQRTRNHRRNG